MNLLLTNNHVDQILGPDPIPSLDVQTDEIQNELQRKMVEEIQCVVCYQFPFKPLECKKCCKLFCKYCQLQIKKEAENAEIEYQAEMRLAQQNSQKKQQPPPSFEPCCPNCNTQGDFLQDVNILLKNCVDFCEFPHRCYDQNGDTDIVWKTMNELQDHAQYECRKFGCDICHIEEFQHMTRKDLMHHIKNHCPAVDVMCQVCNKEFPRAQFGQHQCIKDFYLQKLKSMSFEVLEHLSDKLILHKRQKEGLGLCQKYQCVEKHRANPNSYEEGMIAQNTEAVACKCFRCKTMIAAYEDSYYCIYCNEIYCPPCLGYCKFYDLEEMEDLLLK